jgi:streptogramin lyase
MAGGRNLISVLIGGCLALLLLLAGAGVAQAKSSVRIERVAVGIEPADVVLGPDGAFWMIDERGLLGRLRPGGKPTRVRVAGAAGTRLAVDGWGRVVFSAENRRGRVVLRRVTPDGHVSDVALRGVPRLFQALDVDRIIAGPDGTIWLTTRGEAIVSVSTAGKVNRLVQPYGKIGYPDPISFNDLAVGADGNIHFTGNVVDLGRVTPDGTSVVFDLIPGFNHAESGRFYYTAMLAGPGADIWTIGAYGDGADELDFDNLGQVFSDGSGGGGFLVRGSSPGMNGAVAGLDGRIWSVATRVSKLFAISLAGADQTSPRGRARIVATRRIGRRVGVQLSCVGQTGGYCTGKLRLRIEGDRAGRAVRYALAAGPAAVRIRSARWIRLGDSAARKIRHGARLAVNGPGGVRRVR